MVRVLAIAYPDAHCELDYQTPLELAVATILSAQTTDKRVNETTPALFARYHSASDYAAVDRNAVPLIDSRMPIRPDSPYALGKALGESAARYYADAFGLSTSFIVLQLQETLTAARTAEVQAIADYNKTLAQLAFAEGRSFRSTPTTC